ncbi:MAG TPA: PD-(D/E)XK nuclease family protein [Mesotoga sp.]|nr:PD-(D/E)XK nuclease family protein [Mesotoga sp.]
MFNSYLGNSPTPLLFGENLKRDLDQIEFGVQFLKRKDVVALNIPFALDRFSNPVPFDEPEVVFRGRAQCLYTAPGSGIGGSGFVRSKSSSDEKSEVRASGLERGIELPEHLTTSYGSSLDENDGLGSSSPTPYHEPATPALILCHFKAGFGDPDWERLFIYAWALSRQGYDIGRIEWVSLSAGASISKEVTRENLEEAGINLYAWISQILQSDFSPEAGDHCSYCLYHSFCPLMEKLGEDLMITDSDSLKSTLQKTVAFQEGAKKMKKLADEFIDREGIGKVELQGYEYASDEAPTQIRLLDREAALDTVVGLPDPFKFITFRNLSELVDYLPEDAYEKKEKLKPVRRFRKA